MWHFIQFLFLFIAGHSLADTALQPDAMGRGKSRLRKIDISRVPPGQKPLNLWFMWLSHHAVLHGLIVTCITYFLVQDKFFAINLGIIEFILHWIIDFYKCEGKYNPYIDQGLHYLVKIGFVIMILTSFNFLWF